MRTEAQQRRGQPNSTQKKKKKKKKSSALQRARTLLVQLARRAAIPPQQKTNRRVKYVVPVKQTSPALSLPRANDGRVRVQRVVQLPPPRLPPQAVVRPTPQQQRITYVRQPPSGRGRNTRDNGRSQLRTRLRQTTQDLLQLMLRTQSTKQQANAKLADRNAAVKNPAAAQQPKMEQLKRGQQGASSANLQRQLNAAQAQLANAQKKLASAQQRGAGGDPQAVDSLRTKVEELQETVKQRNEAINKLKRGQQGASSANLQRQLNAAKAQLAIAQKNPANAQQRGAGGDAQAVESLRANVKALQENVKQRNEAINQLKREQQGGGSGNLQRQLNAAKAQLANAQAALRNAQQQSSTTVRQFQGNIDARNAQIRQLQEAPKEASTKNAQLREQEQKLKNATAQVEQLVAQAKEQTAQLERLAQAGRNAEQKATEALAAKGQANALVRELRVQAEQQRAGVLSQAQALQGNAEQKLAELQELRQRLANVSSNRNQKSNQINELVKEVERLTAEVRGYANKAQQQDEAMLPGLANALKRGNARFGAKYKEVAKVLKNFVPAPNASAGTGREDKVVAAAMKIKSELNLARAEVQRLQQNAQRRPTAGGPANGQLANLQGRLNDTKSRLDWSTLSYEKLQELQQATKRDLNQRNQNLATTKQQLENVKEQLEKAQPALAQQLKDRNATIASLEAMVKQLTDRLPVFNAESWNTNSRTSALRNALGAVRANRRSAENAMREAQQQAQERLRELTQAQEQLKKLQQEKEEIQQRYNAHDQLIAELQNRTANYNARGARIADLEAGTAHFGAQLANLRLKLKNCNERAVAPAAPHNAATTPPTANVPPANTPQGRNGQPRFCEEVIVWFNWFMPMVQHHLRQYEEVALRGQVLTDKQQHDLKMLKDAADMWYGTCINITREPPNTHCQRMMELQRIVYQEWPNYMGHRNGIKELLENVAPRVYVRIRAPSANNSSVVRATQSGVVVECKGAKVMYDNFAGVFGGSMTNQDMVRARGKNNNAAANGRSNMWSTFELLAQGHNVVLFGYGYSGSGKTYTLLGDDSRGVQGVVQLGLQRLKEQYSNFTVDVKSIFEQYVDLNKTRLDLRGGEERLNGQLIRLYGQLPQGVGLRSGTGGARTVDEDLTKEIQDILHKYSQDIGAMLSSVLRLTTDHRVRSGRIDKTPHNDQSSRSHLYVTLKCTFPELLNKTCYLTVVDMAGQEDPVAIFDHYAKDQQRTRRSSGVVSAMMNGLAGQLIRVDRGKNVEGVTKLLREGLYINETLNHLTYFFKNIGTRNAANLPVQRKLDQRGYDPTLVFASPKDEYDPPARDAKSRIEMIPILKGLRALPSEAETRFVMLCTIRQDPLYCGGAMATLDFADEIKST